MDDPLPSPNLFVEKALVFTVTAQHAVSPGSLAVDALPFSHHLHEFTSTIRTCFTNGSIFPTAGAFSVRIIFIFPTNEAHCSNLSLLFTLRTCAFLGPLRAFKPNEW
jgi:hypothetical protein